MRIMCSGGIFDQSIEHTECLQCALNSRGAQPCQLSYPLLLAIFQHENGEQRRSEIHVTNLTTCLAKSYWEMVSPEPFYPHDRFYVFLGKVVHEAVERALEGNDEFLAEQNLKLGEVVGRADLIGQGAIWDIKTTRWIGANAQLPRGSHQEQVEIYAAMYNQDTEAPVTDGFIQYIDMSGPTTCRKCRKAYRLVDGMPTCPVCGTMNPNAHLGAVIKSFPTENNEEVATTMQLRAGMLRDALDSGVIPEAEPGWICSYCDFTRYCPAYNGE